MLTTGPLPLPGFWLQALSAHPILESSTHDECSEETGQDTIYDISIIAPETPSAHTLDVPGTELNDISGSLEELDARHSLLAVHEGLAAVWCPRGRPSLRVMNLRKWKGLLDELGDNVEAATQEAEYKEIIIPDVNFKVRQIGFNASGRLLAVAGDRQVVVAVLPRLSWGSDVRNQVLTAKSWKVGLHSTNVAKVRWHPLSEKQQHLTVLCEDGLLKLYDVARDSDLPEQTFHFIERYASRLANGTPSIRNRAGMFGADMEDEEFASFCFGQFDEGWGAMAVYGLTKSGDVYSLCPVLPKRSVFMPQHLTDLKAATVAEQKELANDPQLSSYTDSMYYWRTQWLDTILHEVQLQNETQTLPGDPVALTLPRSAQKLSIKPRGPFLLRPSPDVSRDYGEACDIFCLPTSPVPVLAIGFTAGLIRLCIDVEGAVPSWNISTLPTAAESELPLLRVHEEIDLNFEDLLGIPVSPSDTQCSFAGDPRYDHIFYCYHTAGVHSINVQSWLQPLLDVYTSEAETLEVRVEAVMEHHSDSDVSFLTSSANASNLDIDPVVGFATMTEASLGYSYLLMTSAPLLYGDTLPTQIQLPPGADEEVPADSTYAPALTRPMYEIPEIARRPPTKVQLPKGVAGNQDLGTCTDVNTLWAFFEHVKSRRTDLVVMHRSVEELQKRLTRQKQELAQQVALLGVWEETLAKKPASLDAVADRVTAIRQKEYLQRKRLGIMLQILMDESQPLTQAEKKWNKELKVLRKRVDDELLPMQDEIVAEMNKLRLGASKTVDASRLDSHDLGQSQLNRISTALDQEYRLLAATSQKMQAVKDMARRAEDALRARTTVPGTPSASA
ncbi:hypothetical protein DFS34DRAFT_617719 [Phlyctochytrium arcticum]|nr:hypothetical protein DFS34DRAFT_617719 [Phlyctochytrium arcticum]